MVHAKEVLFFEKAGAKIKKPKTPLKLQYAKKYRFLRANEKRKNGYDFARWLACAEKLQGAKNRCNLLTGQKAAKAGLGVFDGGRSGGGSIRAIGKKSLGVGGRGGGSIWGICRKKTAGTGGVAANWGNPGYWQKNHWALVAGQSGPLVKNHWSLAAGRLIGAICKNALCRRRKNTPYKRPNRELFKIRPNLICGVYRYPPFVI